MDVDVKFTQSVSRDVFNTIQAIKSLLTVLSAELIGDRKALRYSRIILKLGKSVKRLLKPKSYSPQLVKVLMLLLH